jgi:hypothetical protein
VFFVPFWMKVLYSPFSFFASIETIIDWLPKVSAAFLTRSGFSIACVFITAFSAPALKIARI